RFSPIVSPRGAIALRPASKTTFKLVYSQAFRAPTWAETDSRTYQQVQSEDIQPEIARSVEGSMEQRFGTHRLLFGLFRTWWSNLIEARGLSPAERSELQLQGKLPITAIQVSQYRNVSSIDNYGWNGALSGTFADTRLGYGLNATAAFTRKNAPDGSTQELEVAPQVFGNARLSYDLGGLFPSPSLAAYFVGTRPPARAFDGTFSPVMQAPALAEFRATLSGPVPGLTGLGYRLGATYTTASRGAYIVGPDSTPQGVSQSRALRPADLLPLDPFSVFLGVRYDFLTGSGSSEEQP
ncbi:MAG TPA: TonB-dependent receptor, partial [Polyangiaceae bacterium]|nr:TonB-dependent receptor [Polyangiaceae bacterium]